MGEREVFGPGSGQRRAGAVVGARRAPLALSRGARGRQPVMDVPVGVGGALGEADAEARKILVVAGYVVIDARDNLAVGGPARLVGVEQVAFVVVALADHEEGRRGNRVNVLA